MGQNSRHLPEFQFLIGIINLHLLVDHTSHIDQFQFLIGIINLAYLSHIYIIPYLFQFLIGIINLPTKVLPKPISKVSIPHRYYKSLWLIWLQVFKQQFQFLIGIINPDPTAYAALKPIVFQFLIGIINLEHFSNLTP